VSGIEIERTWLLRCVPALPPGAAASRIEQGYLPDEPGGAGAGRGDLVEGRLRRSTGPDGRVVCTHTIKRGTGLVRQEQERRITAAEFERHWPRTAGRRLVKTRHRVAEGGFTWEIDVYDGLDLVLAEVELPSADTEVALPAWLAPHVVRDVTEEPEYRNYRIALRIGGR
jgi:hypothetical protein